MEKSAGNDIIMLFHCWCHGTIWTDLRCGPFSGHLHRLMVEYWHGWVLSREKDLPDANIHRQCFPLTPPAPMHTPPRATRPPPYAKKEKGLHRHCAHPLYLKQAAAFFYQLTVSSNWGLNLSNVEQVFALTPAQVGHRKKKRLKGK